MFKVQKRDGRLEDFSRRKVVMAAIKSGATNAEAENLAIKIENLLPSLSIGGIVKSQVLRVRAMESLKVINPKVSKSFEFFRKPS